MKITRFLIYGLMGWGLEIFWTGLGSAIAGDVRLAGRTYLWMFPIYGMAVLLEPVHDRIRHLPWLIRGVFWVIVIWFLEYATGGTIRLLTGASPWDYSGARWQLDGLIRFDMAPLWLITGLLFERFHDFLVTRLRL
ncbi:MAG: putative ABC transporter permease [Bacillota bacterium]